MMLLFNGKLLGCYDVLPQDIFKPSQNQVCLNISYHLFQSPKQITLPKTNSSPLKIGHPKKEHSISNHPFSGATNVSFRESIYNAKKKTKPELGASFGRIPLPFGGYMESIWQLPPSLTQHWTRLGQGICLCGIHGEELNPQQLRSYIYIYT